MTKVRILVGAEGSYACIKTETKSLDVFLAPGKGAADRMLESAQEMRAKAARLLANAALVESAAKSV